MGDVDRDSDQVSGAELPHKSTARIRREAAKVDIGRRLLSAMLQCGIGPAELGRWCGVSTTLVTKWLDPDCRESPTLADIEQMPRRLALLLLRDSLEALHVEVSDRITPENVGDHLGHLHTILRECGEVGSKYAAALSDGVLDAEEAHELHLETIQAYAALLSLSNEMKRILRERGKVVRLPSAENDR